MSQYGDCSPTDDVEYPRFDHGERLEVLVYRDGVTEFRTDSPWEYVWSDTVVYVDDMV